ncbi:hypothetical protein BD410DRAFT_836264 [Rickenella mellea]|uniref:Lethal giant larvae (Lgl)-like C-terminal domain-containing protein n=1 Tax=Rickenella mellea TaxID=50990 RepID=A0A4Y7QFD7_9AGAM|nr:hypothetical protein BD410DRAFT_836264 [Rickenella mellea]
MDALFKGKGAYNDFSYDLRDARDWSVASLKEIKCLSNITSFAVDPLSGLVAFGSSSGSIHIHGGPAVEKLFKLPKAASVKLLQFASSSFKLVCVDKNDTLHIWDLNVYGNPKLEKSFHVKNSVLSIALSPNHDHIFIAMKSGEIATFDLLCLRISPYTIPNMWKEFEEKMLASGMPFSPTPGSTTPLEMVHHPRDLNLLFLAYAGGIALCDITDRVALRHYELVLPPGAQGGMGYSDPDILQHRRPQVTALAVHPSGHLFAVGYTDGSIAFWAVEDEDKPLTVRTLDEDDVNVVNGERLAEMLSSQNPGGASSRTPQHISLREPIFKLTWSGSDLSHGRTILTMLGGTFPGDSGGVFALLFSALEPPSVLPAPTSSHAQQNLSPHIRAALVDSVKIKNQAFYSTSGLCQDFLLVPKDNPYFSCAYDPFAILLLSEEQGGTRCVQAYEFPPPEFSTTELSNEPSEPVQLAQTDSDQLLDEGLSSALEELDVPRDPAQLTLPTSLLSGMNAVLDGDVVRLSRYAYELLVGSEEPPPYESPMRGGAAYIDMEHANLQVMKFAKYHPNKLLVTHHRDLTVRFQDMSPQRLICLDELPLTTSWPTPLPLLTINVNALISEPSIASHHHPISPRNTEIQSAKLSAESQTCSVVFKSGHILVYRVPGEAQQMSVEAYPDDEELVTLGRVPTKGRFQPVLMIDNSHGSVTICEVSDLGLMAIAYFGGALLIVDLTIPKVIVRDIFDTKGKKDRGLHLHSPEGSGKYRMQSLSWVICGFGQDSTPRVRLMASHHSGSTHIFTLDRPHQDRPWTVSSDVKVTEGYEDPLPRSSFILNGRTGAVCKADKETFKASDVRGHSPRPSEDVHSFWISAGHKGVKCIANVNGSRVGRAEWGKGKVIECVEILARNGIYVLCAITATRELLTYALPSLDYMHSFQLPSTPNSAISLDDTGDYVDWTFDPRTNAVSQISLGTFFKINHPYNDTVVDLAVGRRSLPPQPQPIPLGPTTLLGSLLNYKRSVTGDQIDALLAGPDRPPIKPSHARIDPESQKQRESKAQAVASQTSGMGSASGLYSSLSTALAERGEMLGDLEEGFRSLETGTKNMVSQAKKLAAQQTAKGWFGW